MLILLMVVIAMIFNVIVVLAKDNNVLRTITSCAIVLIVVITASAWFYHYGTFGNPTSLNGKTFYKVLTVVPIDEKSTAVILRNEAGEIVPIKFLTPVTAKLNRLYVVVGDDLKNYNLAPIK